MKLRLFSLFALGVMLAASGCRGGESHAPLADATPPAATQAGEIWTRPSDGMRMVYVPAGQFVRGASDDDPDAQDDEKPRKAIYLDAYWIDQTEVTNAMYAAFAQATGYRSDAEREKGITRMVDFETQEWTEKSGLTWQHPTGPGSSLAGLDDHPVVIVSWNDATAYCAWAGARLPSEAEWEKAGSGVDAFYYPWGSTFDGARLNFCDRNCPFEWADTAFDDGWITTAPVGSYPAGASPYGALDLDGNVSEWVRDFFGQDYYASAPLENPFGPEKGSRRIVRGASWLSYPWAARLSNRSDVRPLVGDFDLGFRCALGTAPTN